MFRLRRRGSGPSDEPPAVPPARGYGGGVGRGGGEERSAWAGRRGQGRQARAFICVRRRVGRAEVVRCACAARQCQLETWKGWVDGWLDRSIDRSIKPEERRGARPGQEGRKPNQGKVGDDREKGEGRHPTNQPQQLAPSTGPSSRRRILDHAYSS